MCLLLVAAATVFLGTLYPLFLDALGSWAKSRSGHRILKRFLYRLMIPVLLMMARRHRLCVGKMHEPGEVWHALKWVLAATVLAVIGSSLIQRVSPMVALGLGCAFWIVFASFWHLWQRLGKARQLPLTTRLANLPNSYWGMWLAHVGIGIFVVGVTLVRGFEVAEDVKMQVGDRMTLGSYQFHLSKIDKPQWPELHQHRGRIRGGTGRAQAGRAAPGKAHL